MWKRFVEVNKINKQIEKKLFLIKKLKSKIKIKIYITYFKNIKYLLKIIYILTY